MQRRRVLITGASGLLGLNTALELAARHTVIGQVHRTKIQSEIFTVVQADLLAPGSVPRLLDQTQPDWVIHCAGLTNVDACEADPQQAYQLNSTVPAQLAEHVARGGARLLHVSTDAVFDGSRCGYRESDAPNPVNVYGRTKLYGEQGVLAANPQAIVARVNLFGWSASGQRSLAEFFFHHLREGKAAPGFVDVFFCPLLANDLGRLFEEMLAKGLHGLYHAVGSECLSKYDFGVRIARLFGFDEGLIVPTSVKEVRMKAERPPNLTLLNEKLAQVLGHKIGDASAGLERFRTLYAEGYPQRLRNMVQSFYPG